MAIQRGGVSRYFSKVLGSGVNWTLLKKGGFGECALVPVFAPREHANVPSFRFSFRGNIRMYPRSGFRSGGTSAKTTLLEDHPFANPPKDRGNDLQGMKSALCIAVICVCSDVERQGSQGPADRVGFQTGGGVCRSGLVIPFLSFLGLSRFFRDFPDLSGDFPDLSFCSFAAY